MNPVEIAAALLGLANVALVARRSMLNYPFGIAMVALYFFVFAEAKLYSDALLQIFFLAIQLYGWVNWRASAAAAGSIAVETLDTLARLRWLAGTATAVLIWGTGMARFTDATAPFADATVAGISVAAQLLQARRKVESWVLWIAVDVLAVGLFAWRGLTVTSGLYAVFLVMSLVGLVSWHRALRGASA